MGTWAVVKQTAGRSEAQRGVVQAEQESLSPAQDGAGDRGIGGRRWECGAATWREGEEERKRREEGEGVREAAWWSSPAVGEGI